MWVSVYAQDSTESVHQWAKACPPSDWSKQEQAALALLAEQLPPLPKLALPAAQIQGNCRLA